MDLPSWLDGPFAAAMSQSMLLPAFIALFGVVAAMFMLGFGKENLDPPAPTEHRDEPYAAYPVEHGGDQSFVDDDEYVEYTIAWDEPAPARVAEPVQMMDDEGDTEPIRVSTEPIRVSTEPPPPTPELPTESPHEPWRSILDELLGDMPAKPAVEPIGFAHNGFHVDDEQRFEPLRHPDPIAEPRSSAADAYSSDIHGGGHSRHSRGSHARHEDRHDYERPSRHHRHEEQPEPRQFWFDSNGRHSRDDPDDASRYGRHSMPGRD
jgi:hypothetical protein